MARPRKIKVDEVGMVKNEDGKFEFLSKDGTKNSLKVKWRDLVDESFLYINEGFYKRKEKSIPENISEAEDDGVIIRLIGLRDLANRHGYKSVNYELLSLDNDNCVMRCKIIWEPTSYNGYREVITEGIASANRDNIFGIAFKFKEANASNRAFARAVREYFCIFSVCEEELEKPDFEKGTDTSSAPAVRPTNLRSNKVLEKTVQTILDMDTFFEFREKFVKPRLELLALDDTFLSYEKYEEVPSDVCKKLTAEIRKSNKSKKI